MNVVVFWKLNLDNSSLSDLSPNPINKDVGNGEEFVLKNGKYIFVLFNIGALYKDLGKSRV